MPEVRSIAVVGADQALAEKVTYLQNAVGAVAGPFDSFLVLRALKTYGMYIADGGSNMYIQGDPSAAWQDSTFSQVQSVGSSQFEAVDLAPIMGRAGFDPNSAAVPAP